MISGRGIVVNLSTQKVYTEPLDRETVSLFLGGNGIGAYLLFEKMRLKDPFSPESWIIFVPGVLNGSTFPMTSKCGFFGLSPLTGCFGESYFGASLGVSLKSRKIDFLAVTGRCEDLSCIVVDERVLIEKAPSLAGMLTSECERTLREKYRGSSAYIGPAGENLVKFAAIAGDGRQAGRTGLGAVLGSKKVKGIVVVPDETDVSERMREVRKKCVKGFLEGTGTLLIKDITLWGRGSQLFPSRRNGGYFHLIVIWHFSI